MQEFKCGALAGLFLFISYYFQTYGLKYTTASKNAFITTLYVVIVPFLAWAVNHVRPKANNLVAAGFAVVGLALLSLKGDLSVNFGDFLTLVCGICFAVHMIFLDRFTAYCTPIRLTVMQMGTAAACSWVLGLLTEGAFHPEVFTPVSYTHLFSDGCKTVQYNEKYVRLYRLLSGQTRVCHGNRHGLSVDGNLFV